MVDSKEDTGTLGQQRSHADRVTVEEASGLATTAGALANRTTRRNSMKSIVVSGKASLRGVHSSARAVLPTHASG